MYVVIAPLLVRSLQLLRFWSTYEPKTFIRVSHSHQTLVGAISLSLSLSNCCEVGRLMYVGIAPLMFPLHHVGGSG
jgi:hypothetical protein